MAVVQDQIEYGIFRLLSLQTFEKFLGNLNTAIVKEPLFSPLFFGLLNAVTDADEAETGGHGGPSTFGYKARIHQAINRYFKLTFKRKTMVVPFGVNAH